MECWISNLGQLCAWKFPTYRTVFLTPYFSFLTHSRVVSSGEVKSLESGFDPDQVFSQCLNGVAFPLEFLCPLLKQPPHCHCLSHLCVEIYTEESQERLRAIELIENQDQGGRCGESEKC